MKILNEAASNAIVLDNDSKYIVASQIALNIQGEYDAIDGYNKIIPYFLKYGDQESVDQIKEIIADEKNHSNELNKILLKYDGNVLPKED